MFLGGSKVGYSHSTMKLEKGEVISKSTFVMSVRRAGVVIEIKSMESTRELLSGEIISFSGKMEMAGGPVIKKGWGQDIAALSNMAESLVNLSIKNPHDRQYIPLISRVVERAVHTNVNPYKNDIYKVNNFF